MRSGETFDDMKKAYFLQRIRRRLGHFVNASATINAAFTIVQTGDTYVPPTGEFAELSEYLNLTILDAAIERDLVVAEAPPPPVVRMHMT